MKRIKNDIDNKTFGRVYLLYGPESYLRLHYTKRLCDAIVPETDTMNRLNLDGDKVRESEVIDFAETLPFFADHRLTSEAAFSKLLKMPATSRSLPSRRKRHS